MGNLARPAKVRAERLENARRIVEPGNLGRLVAAGAASFFMLGAGAPRHLDVSWKDRLQ